MCEDSGDSRPSSCRSSAPISWRRTEPLHSKPSGERNPVGNFVSKRDESLTFEWSAGELRRIRRQIEIWIKRATQEGSGDFSNELLIEELSREWRFRGSWVNAGLCAMKLAAETRDRSNADFGVGLEMAVIPFSFEVPLCLGIAQLRACLAWNSPRLFLFRPDQQPECDGRSDLKLGFTSVDFTFIDDVPVRRGRVFSWMQAESLEFVSRMYLFA